MRVFLYTYNAWGILMKLKIKSLFFWAVFFFLLICLLFWGVFFFINKDNIYYTLGRIVEILGYIFVALYLIFAILILINKFPERIKNFEKFRYLALMFVLHFIELMVIVSALPDLD